MAKTFWGLYATILIEGAVAPPYLAAILIDKLAKTDLEGRLVSIDPYLCKIVEKADEYSPTINKAILGKLVGAAFGRVMHI